jgi:hypothetical protein
MNKNFVITGCLGLGMALSVSFVFGAEDDYKVSKMHLDQTMAPKNVLDGINDIKNSPIGMAIINAAAAYIGVNPAIVTLALKAIPSGSMAGEEGRYSIPTEAGYKYCRARINVISINPASGDRASVLNATANNNGIAIYTWTPKQGVGGGRSWAEAEFELVSVRDDLYDQSIKAGTCKPSNDRALLRCKGSANCHSMAD